MSDSIAITSGKGGVGKTTIAVNLSIAYKKLLNDVLLLDTDLGMANSHVLHCKKCNKEGPGGKQKKSLFQTS